MNESVRIQSIFFNDTKYCNISDKMKLSWMGDFELLKCFIAKGIKFDGTWKSPGGERKSCTDGKTTITWWKRRNPFKHVVLKLNLSTIVLLCFDGQS